MYTYNNMYRSQIVDSKILLDLSLNYEPNKIVRVVSNYVTKVL